MIIQNIYNLEVKKHDNDFQYLESWVITPYNEATKAILNTIIKRMVGQGIESEPNSNQRLFKDKIKAGYEDLVEILSDEIHKIDSSN
jgi:hypothetical protein